MTAPTIHYGAIARRRATTKRLARRGFDMRTSLRFRLHLVNYPHADWVRHVKP